MPSDSKRVMYIGPSNLTVDEAIEQALRVQMRTFPKDEQPDIDDVKKVVLQSGKYVFKVATSWGIRSRNSGEHKFRNLVLATLRRTKSRGWEFETHRSITLGDKNNTDTIQKLFSFLASLPHLNSHGDVAVVNLKDLNATQFGEILTAVSKNSKKSDLISQILLWVNSDPQALEGLTQLSSNDPLRSKSLVAALNYGRYHRALDEFRQMVDANLREQEYQRFLEGHHWMFGSEYSELIETRTLVLGHQLDFPLRRTVDGYIDAIEIKTPLGGRSGFYFDASHNNYYPGSDVYKYVSQVRNYLSSLEAERHQIRSKFGIDVTKVRGKLVIGRDGNEQEQEALTLFNHDSRSVEVITFDGLIRIGQRILEIMVEQNPFLSSVSLEGIEHNLSAVSGDDIPF